MTEAKFSKGDRVCITRHGAIKYYIVEKVSRSARYGYFYTLSEFQTAYEDELMEVGSEEWYET